MNEGTILRAADRQAQAWKNGGGVTREIAIGGLSPDGTFDWRVSMADVTIAGPFSTFDGIDRTLCVLSGTLSLEVAGRPPVTLDPASEPFAFAGEVRTHGAPAGGPVLDLNVMTRRAGWRADVTRLSGAASITAARTILVLATGSAIVDGQELDRFDAYLTHGCTVSVTSATPVYVVRIESKN